MAKLKLSKSALAQQRTQLKLYQKLLPSLDLKRRQLTIEHDKSRQELARAREAVSALERRIGDELPMLAVREIDVSELVRIGDISIGEENLVGVRVPALERIEFEVAPYSLLAKPAWVDVFVERLKETVEQHIRLQIAEQRVQALGQAVRRVTQRVNLFDRILIPTAKKNIARIQIFLGDLDRDAVVRSKIAKAKNISRSAPAGESAA